MKQAIISIDGASKGNPGPSGIGIVIRDSSGMVLKEVSEYIGETTNNVAEYTALIRALSETMDLGFTRAEIQSDSELMVKQINGQYRVKNEGIMPLYEEAVDLIRRFNYCSLVYISRERNKLADKLASDAASPKDKPKPEPEPDIMEIQEEPVIPVVQIDNKAHRINVHTSSRCQFVNITADIQKVVESSQVVDGICTVFVPHTTAGITINENADPDVVTDILSTLKGMIPADGPYRHSEGNSDAHLKASLMGFSVTVFVENGTLLLGTWQGIFFCEFDGPRNRHVFVKVI